MTTPNENGSYAISEQGDLGLGLTPVDESQIKKSDDEEKETTELV